MLLDELEDGARVPTLGAPPVLDGPLALLLSLPLLPIRKLQPLSRLPSRPREPPLYKGIGRAWVATRSIYDGYASSVPAWLVRAVALCLRPS